MPLSGLVAQVSVAEFDHIKVGERMSSEESDTRAPPATEPAEDSTSSNQTNKRTKLNDDSEIQLVIEHGNELSASVSRFHFTQELYSFHSFRDK